MLGRFCALSGWVALQPDALHALFTVPWTVPSAGIHITKTGFTMAAFEILIADDHPLFRSALQQALTLGLGPDVRLVEAASIAELEACLVQKTDWDLVLLDLNMPGAYGFSGLVLLRGQYPHIPVVMISAQEEPSIVARAREFGASGFIPKSSPLELIQQAVRLVLDGEVWWPQQSQEAIALSAEAKAASAGLASLTPQQFRVLTMVCDGLLNKQIAYELGVSEATVKAHVTAIFRKLGVRTRTQAALLLQQLETIASS
jgi:DNA-binding NarL/FixJ family response regulator